MTFADTPHASTPMLLFPAIDFEFVKTNVYRFVRTDPQAPPPASTLPAEDIARVSAVLSEAVAHMEALIKEYTPSEIAIAFNGGKDCTVLLYLLVAVYQHHFPNRTWPIPAVLVEHAQVFKEEQAFVAKCEARYALVLARYPAPMRTALFAFHTATPAVRAVLVGARRTDTPGASTLRAMQPCDPGWPPLVRAHPLLAWSVRDVWRVLHALDIEYCALYDRGYTSLGDARTTAPNPHLATTACVGGFWPAWTLTSDALERVGRGSECGGAKTNGTHSVNDEDAADA